MIGVTAFCLVCATIRGFNLDWGGAFFALAIAAPLVWFVVSCVRIVRLSRRDHLLRLVRRVPCPTLASACDLEETSSMTPESSIPGPPAPGESAEPVPRRSPWGAICAILLFVYGAVPLLFGILGLLFVPGILSGGVTIGRHTTVANIIGWILFHVAITAHGYAVIVAAVRFWRVQWRRGLYAIALGLIVLGILVPSAYLMALFN